MTNERTGLEKLFIFLTLIVVIVGTYLGVKQPQSEDETPYTGNEIGNTNTITKVEERKVSLGEEEKSVETTTRNTITDTKQTSGTIKHTNNSGSKSIGMMSGGSVIRESLLNAGVHKDMVDIVRKVGKEYKIHPYYIAMVGLAENIRNPRAIGDRGCSYGAYQFNKCPGNRREQVWFGKKFEACAKDYECSTKMVAEKIRSAYKCEVSSGGYIKEFYKCLPIHNGLNYKQRYVNKLIKANEVLFGMGG